MQETAYIFDTSKFSSTLTKAIENNNVIFRDGVAYWKKDWNIKESFNIFH